MKTKSIPRSDIFFTVRICFVWISVLGLLLAGGWQSHAHETSDHHHRDFAQGDVASDRHAHMGTDRADSNSPADRVVHCGANLLALSRPAAFPWPERSIRGCLSPAGAWGNFDLEHDPPPPRFLS